MMTNALEQERLGALLRRYVAEANQETGPKITQELIADQTQVARSAVSAWLANKQKPRRKQIEALAELFSRGNPVLKQQYRMELLKAVGEPAERSGAMDPMTRAREQSGAIHCGVARFDEHFDLFFTNVLTAFGEYCAFSPPIVRPVEFPDLAPEIAKNNVHIGGGLLSTPDRLQTLRFIPTPITLGYNAITFAAGKRALQRGTERSIDVDRVRPILNDGQANFAYAIRVLKIDHLQIETCEYDRDSFISAFEQAYAAWEHESKTDERSRVPVIMSDEVMLLKIHVELTRRLLSSTFGAKSLEDVGPPVLLMGNANRWSRKGSTAVATHPRFNVSLCMKRLPSDEWYSYIHEAWQTFLRGNTDFVAQQYDHLYSGLRQEFIVDFREGIAERLAKIKRTSNVEENDLEKVLVTEWDELLESWFRNNLGAPWDEIEARALSCRHNARPPTVAELRQNVERRLESIEDMLRRLIDTFPTEEHK